MNKVLLYTHIIGYRDEFILSVIKMIGILLDIILFLVASMGCCFLGTYFWYIVSGIEIIVINNGFHHSKGFASLNIMIICLSLYRIKKILDGLYF